MISSLRGRVEDITGNCLTLDVNGVGYDVTCSRNLLSRLILDGEAKFPVHTEVREDAIRLFGFEDRSERQVFLLLNRVNGLGPKLAIDILSQVEKRDLLRAIGAGNITALTAVRGVGRKKAERMVVELRDIVSAFSLERPSGLNSLVEVSTVEQDGASSDMRDAVAALEVLGFVKRDAERAVREAQSASLGRDPGTSGDLVREALKFI